MTTAATAAPRTIRALIDAQAATRAQAVYFVAADTGATMSFGELAAGCRRLAAVFAARGLSPGDTVAVLMPNGLQTARLLLAGLYNGLRMHPVNLLSQHEPMRYVLEHGDCRLVFASPDWAPTARRMADGFERRVDVVEVDPDTTAWPGEPETGGALRAAGDSQRRAAPAASPFDVAPTPDAPAILMYTSGTTGRPKGVVLTQSALAANAHAISREHRLGPADRVLAVLPLYHINGLVVTLLAPLSHGGSLAMPAKFSAQRYWQQAATHACTWLNVVPTMISFLLEGADPPPGLRGRLRFCRSASAALAPEHHRAFERRFGIGIIETMGLTETAAPSFSNPFEPALRKVGSVGRASGCEAAVVEAAVVEAAAPGPAAPQPVADGVTGEIVIRGPHVMSGYYKNPEASAQAFTADGWLRTGDLGHRDADGFFFVTGRIKELIIKGGENIAPREIDEALLRHPAVLDAAAVGIADRHYGQEILACVQLREGATCSEEELRRFCESQLGRYKTPKVLRFVAELPRGPSGKVQRLKLLEP